MNLEGLTNRQESALARIWMAQDSLPDDFTDWGITDDLLVLRDCGMIDMQTDWGQTLAFVQRLLPLGREHYTMARKVRKRSANLRDSADELIGRLCTDWDKDSSDVPPKYYEDRLDDYRALSRAGLLDVMWADNRPYHVRVTDKGFEYVEGNFMMEATVNIENNFTNNNVINGGSASANAEASAEASGNVTLGMTIQALLDADVESEAKERAEASLKELDAAARNKDKTSFAAKLEHAASIAKSTSSLAGIMLPFFKTAIQQFLG